jgi:hypothetical protein
MEAVYLVHDDDFNIIAVFLKYPAAFSKSRRAVSSRKFEIVRSYANQSFCCLSPISPWADNMPRLPRCAPTCQQ